MEGLHGFAETLLALNVRIFQLKHKILQCKLNQTQHLLRTREILGLNLELESAYSEAVFHCIPQSLPPQLNSRTAPQIQATTTSYTRVRIKYS